MEDGRRGSVAGHLYGEGHLDQLLLSVHGALPEVGRHDALDNFQRVRNDCSQLRLFHGQPAGDSFQVGAVALGAPGSILQ